MRAIIIMPTSGVRWLDTLASSCPPTMTPRKIYTIIEKTFRKLGIATQ
jgi:hypothetical protein